MISIYPLGKDLYAFAETPFIHRIDPVTMETTRRVRRASKSMKQLKYLPVIV
jgi:carotenoid isomerooxygenase